MANQEAVAKADRIENPRKNFARVGVHE